MESEFGSSDPGILLLEHAEMTDFVQIEETDVPGTFRLPVTTALCVGAPSKRFMFGGVGLAAGISAIERFSNQQLIWATAHYYSFVRELQELSLEVQIAATSKHMVHASVTVHAGSDVAFRCMGTLGQQPSIDSRRWLSAPDVPSPEACPEGHHWRGDHGGLHGRLEIRVAKGRYGRDRIGMAEPDGRLVLWVRTKEALDVSAQLLAVVADLLPNAVGNALGQNAGGSSLDNTLRVVRLQPTTWILAEIFIHAIERGIAHGEVRLFTESRELLAIANQSLVVRVRE